MGSELHFLNFFSYYYDFIFVAHDVYKMYR
jgi:hypothetical protein